MLKENLEYILLIVITSVVVITLTYMSRRVLDFIIRRNSEQLQADPTNFIFLKNSISYIFIFIGLFWVFHKIPYFNSLGNALFAGAGVIAAVIGFASQKAFSNIIGGLFILIFKPFRVHDVIEISNNRRGVVEEITLRHTIIKDFESRRIVIPNSQISDETIINSSLTDERIRKQIDISVSYESDLDIAIKILQKVIGEHANCVDNRTPIEIESNTPIVEVRVISYGDSSINLRAYVWTVDNFHSFILQCDVLKVLKSKFDEEGINIPYPHRTINFQKPNEHILS